MIRSLSLSVLTRTLHAWVGGVMFCFLAHLWGFGDAFKATLGLKPISKPPEGGWQM